QILRDPERRRDQRADSMLAFRALRVGAVVRARRDQRGPARLLGTDGAPPWDSRDVAHLGSPGHEPRDFLARRGRTRTRRTAPGRTLARHALDPARIRGLVRGLRD